MTQRSGKLHLNAFLLDVGHHEASWRLPESNPHAGSDVEHFKKLARIAERGKLPDLGTIEGAKSRNVLVVELARRERPTVRQLLAKLGGGRGHRTVVGTPEQVADAIALWWNHGAADGFNVMPPVLPSGLEAFVSEVVPILQKRRLFRTEYSGKTLRDNYGLRRPARGSQLQGRSRPGFPSAGKRRLGRTQRLEPSKPRPANPPNNRPPVD